jgi:RNA polymerase sigma-54 factor
MEIAARLSQSQTMNPKMLQSLSILAMTAVDLYQYIREEAEKNPALEVTGEDAAAVPGPGEKWMPSPPLGMADPVFRQSGGSAESDAFQAFLENRPAPGITLREALLQQLRLLSLEESRRVLCERIIGNLDDRGFYAGSPERLLESGPARVPPDAAGKAELAACLDIVRRLEPIGTACSGSMESLLVQAEIRGDAPPLALFFLDGRLELLRSGNVYAIRKKIAALDVSAATPRCPLAFSRSLVGISAADVQGALEYIRTLEPFPACQFSSGTTQYIAPDITVERLEPVLNDPGAYGDGGPGFTVGLAGNFLPRLSVSSSFLRQAQGADKKATAFSRALVREAQWVIGMVRQREQTLHKTAQAIVEAQIPFFERGPRFLRPLRMKDAAQTVGVHEATISRISRGKYIGCEWGLFEVRSFFSGEVAGDAAGGRSREGVKAELKQILAESAGKKPSDEALATELARRGIIIARRTVAKYRHELLSDK